MKHVILAFAVLNIISFLITGYDKLMAKKGGERVETRRFGIMAIFGGALGIWIAMYAFRHKTKTKIFTIGIPCVLLVQAIAAYLIYRAAAGVF